ncbi:hypothetical protein V6N13_090299 [Hibiscus sabdariffa]
MVYDGCFIVQLLRFRIVGDIFKERGILPEILNDLLLLENQLPFVVLSELYHIIAPEDVQQLAHHALSFFRKSSLFHLFDDDLLPNKDIKHLLHLPLTASEPTSQRKMKFIGNATELDDAGINFLGVTLEKMKEPKQGIETEFDIMFTKDTKVLMIPTLRVADLTERRLRNYIAYEQFIPSDDEPTYFSDYVSFMDNLINTSKDVQLLRKSGIIENCLGDDEAVAQMFNRLMDSVWSPEDDFYYAEIFERVDEHCQKRWNRWKALLKKNYFYSPWSHISFFAATVLLLLTIVQTIFSVLSYFDKQN